MAYETVFIEGYEVREPMLDDIPDFFELMQADGATGKLPRALLKACVFKDGVRVGDAIGTIPLRLVVRLSTEAVKAAGLSEPAGNG